MPSVDVAMARSIRPRAWSLIRDALARGAAQDLSRRDIVQDTQDKITDVKTAFSSWDNCMKASFCKWPVIAIIIIGSLIVLSIVWCIIRCCCCGLSCCCSCFTCLKCCGNCCGCCDPPGDRKPKYLDESHVPSQYRQGYQAQAPMQSHFSSSAPAKFAPPQYAEFDVSKKGSEDSLPQMPTWEQAGSKQVLVEEVVELSNLKKSPTMDQNRQRPNAPSPAPPISPMSSVSMNYGGQAYGGNPESSTYQTSNYSEQESVFNQQPANYGRPRQQQYEYGTRAQAYHNSYNAHHQSEGFGLDQPYDEPGSVPATGLRGHQSQNSSYGAPAQQPYDSLANQPYGAVLASGAAGAAGTRTQMVSPFTSQPHVTPPLNNSIVGPGAMGSRSQSSSPIYQQSYSQPPVMGAAVNSGGRQSPASVQSQGQSPYEQDQIHEHYAEMPAMPYDRNSVHTPTHTQQQAQSPHSEQAAPTELPGNDPPDGYDMGCMRMSPGPRQTPGPESESPYGRRSRSPGGGYGQPPPQSPRDHTNRSYSPAPLRELAPGPERQISLLPEHQLSPAPEHQRRPHHLLAKPMPPPSFIHTSPPQSPITNSAGFDFISGYARPQGSQAPPSQSPTTAAYPGQRTYQPGR